MPETSVEMNLPDPNRIPDIVRELLTESPLTLSSITLTEEEAAWALGKLELADLSGQVRRVVLYFEEAQS